MIQSVPTPKLRVISKEQPPVRPQENEPADFRWAFVEEFLRSRELSANSKKAYTRTLKQFLAWTDKGLNELIARDIDRYKAHLKTLPSKRGGTLSTATINQSLYSLQSFFRWLTSREYIERDPMLMIEKLKPDPPKALEWTDKEVKALFDALPEREQTIWRDQAMLWLLLHGLRANEVAALNIRDFDGTRVHILEAKDDSVGSVPLVAEAREAIENYLNWRRAKDLTVEGESPLLLSHSRNNFGERLGYGGIYHAVKGIAEIAGVENAHPHRGRHTMATNLIRKGLDPMLARQLTRHKSESSFARYSKRGLEIEAERQFFEVYGESSTAEVEPIQKSPKPLPIKDDISSPPMPNTPLMSFVFKGGKGATPENRVVHAVLDEAPSIGFWDTPTLCGVRPSLTSWGWIGDCSILYLSCKKCEKKLKAIPHHIRLPKRE